MKQKTQLKELLTIPQAAKILGISRIAVYKKVMSGKIKASKVGRLYIISSKEIIPKSVDVKGKPLSAIDKKKIRQAVMKTIKDYGEVLDLLGKE